MAVVSAFRSIGFVLAAALGLAPLAPPEHVHEVEGHGDHLLLVHRHAEAHHPSHHSDEHQNVLDENETPVLTLTAVYVTPAPPVVLAAPVRVTFAFLDPPVAKSLHPAVDYVERLIHGPPRALVSPRAPPSFLAS